MIDNGRANGSMPRWKARGEGARGRGIGEGALESDFPRQTGGVRVVTSRRAPSVPVLHLRLETSRSSLVAQSSCCWLVAASAAGRECDFGARSSRILGLRSSIWPTPSVVAPGEEDEEARLGA